MRANEFMHEDYLKLKEVEAGGDDMGASVVTLLSMLRNRAQETNANPVMKTQSFLKLVQNMGHKNFGFADLVAANTDNEAVKNLLADCNKDEITLKTDQGEDEQPGAEAGEQGPTNPQKTVSAMAKSAAGV